MKRLGLVLAALLVASPAIADTNTGDSCKTTAATADSIRGFDFFPGDGVLVTHVDPSSRAACLGIKAGDFVKEIAGARVTNLAGLRTALDMPLLVDTKMRVVRQGRELELPLRASGEVSISTLMKDWIRALLPRGGDGHIATK